MPRDENGIWPEWLSPEGVGYKCGTHINWIFDDLEHYLPELYKEFRQWENPTNKSSCEFGTYDFLLDKGWWRKNKYYGEWLWVGHLDATPSQRRYINKDKGERQPNDFFKGPGHSIDQKLSSLQGYVNTVNPEYQAKEIKRLLELKENMK